MGFIQKNQISKIDKKISKLRKESINLNGKLVLQGHAIQSNQRSINTLFKAIYALTQNLTRAEHVNEHIKILGQEILEYEIHF